MPPDAQAVQVAHRWLRYAEADLSFARIPLPANGLYEQLCFHAQQAAEKAIKAVLALQGIDFPKTHNIEFLVDLLPQTIARTPALAQASILTAYATVFRYPGEEEPLSEEEYRTSLVLANSIVEWSKETITALEDRC